MCMIEININKQKVGFIVYLIDKFQSAYRCGHSTETDLLRVYSDIVTMVGNGNGSYLVLLD